MPRRHRTSLTGFWLVLPAVSLLALFTHWPILGTIWASVYSTPKGARPARFIGVDQYQTLAADPIFWKALVNNLIVAGVTIPAAIGLALAMALFVNGKIAGRGVLRLVYFTPTVLPMIAIANIWLFFYTPDYGLLDQIIRAFGGGATNWLGSKETALGALIAVAVWKEAGFFMIFYLAALQQIPPDLLEAARIEGAGRFVIFRRVVFPLLMPTTLFVLVNATINAFRLVDHIIVMTKGGPDNATTVLLLYIYQIGFQFWDSGYAAALSMVLLMILVAVALLQFSLGEKRVHYR